MDSYFTSFRLLTNNIRATRVFNKIGYANALSFWANICKKKKKERGHFEQGTSSKKAV